MSRSLSGSEEIKDISDRQNSVCWRHGGTGAQGVWGRVQTRGETVDLGLCHKGFCGLGNGVWSFISQEQGSQGQSYSSAQMAT